MDQPLLAQALETTGVYESPRRECPAWPVHSEAYGLKGHTQFLRACDGAPSVSTGGPERGEHISLQTWQELRGGSSMNLLGITRWLRAPFCHSVILDLSLSRIIKLFLSVNLSRPP